jgi:sugar phosphate isomerase/epimerase
VTRRTFFQASSAPLALAPLLRGRPVATGGTLTKMGIAWTSYMSYWRPKDAYLLLEHCHELGAVGIQTSLNGDLGKLRARAEELGMYVEGMVPLPKDGDVTAFEHGLQNAKESGATALRAGYLSGRRYETFSTLADWQGFVTAAHKSIEAALPLLDRYKIPLGIENHKDWTADEHVALMKKYSNEYLGVCLDFGNNISLLDDPMDVAVKLAPYTVTTHLKDMAVGPHPAGFVMAEMPLGQGFLDLAKMISLVQQARPATHLTLEMITRDPLVIPCLTDKYWVTFPGRNGIYLARTLTLVSKETGHGKPLPNLAPLSTDERLKQEEENVKLSLGYARETLHV